METLEALEARRSIRRFRSTAVPDDMLETVLRAATLAPSGKNRQPWRFTVVRGDAREEMVRLMRQRIAEMQAQGESTGSAEHSVAVMAQAPVTVFVFNPDGLHPWLPRTVVQTFGEIVDTQSIGAAIQNMLLAAQDVGLGSLWICDVFYAYEELRDWLDEEGQMIAAVALGYPDEQPGPRPRKPLDTVLRWV